MFKRIYIEISDFCNLDCQFCASTRKNKNILNINQFKHIIQEIRGYTKEIYLHVLGEPLVHPDLFKYIELANNEFLVNITTNGTLIKKYEKELLNAPLNRINISLNSEYKKLNISTTEFLSDIWSFIKKKHEKDQTTTFNLRLWAYDSFNTIDICENLERLSEKNIILGKNIALKKRVILTFEKKFTWPSLDKTAIKRTKKCQGGINHIAVLSTGEVAICCLDSLGDSKLGNIFKKSFTEIIQSDSFVNIIENKKQNKFMLEICKHCSYQKGE